MIRQRFPLLIFFQCFFLATFVKSHILIPFQFRGAPHEVGCCLQPFPTRTVRPKFLVSQDNPNQYNHYEEHSHTNHPRLGLVTYQTISLQRL
jgi:hypothetical protein